MPLLKVSYFLIANEDSEVEWFMVQVTSGDACWLIQRNFENFRMLDAQLHQCIFDRKISQLQDLANQSPNDEQLEVRIFGFQFVFFYYSTNVSVLYFKIFWLIMSNRYESTYNRVTICS